MSRWSAKLSKVKYKDVRNVTELRSLKSLLFSYSQPNGFALNATTKRLFPSESIYHTLCTIKTISWRQFVNKTQDLRKRRPTKTKTPYKNKEPLQKQRPTKMKTPLFFVGNEIISMQLFSARTDE